MPSPIEVKTPGIPIYFDSHPEPRTRFKDFFTVNLIPGRRSNWRPVKCPKIVVNGFENGLNDSFGLLLAIKAKLAVLKCSPLQSRTHAKSRQDNQADRLGKMWRFHAMKYMK